jgi:phosphoglycolate phosphatase-like HAD superfamily hydrolase
MSSRRNFLKSSAGLAATLAVGPLAGGQATPVASLPKVRFGNAEISRLIIGANPFNGGSHFNHLLDQLMAEWNTPEQVSQTLHQCQQNGITAYQCSNKGFTQPHLDLFRTQGGKMHLIAIDASKNVEEMVRRSEAGAFYHHGEVTDVLFRDGKMDGVQEYIKRLRQTGVRVGIGTHKPEVVEYVEERGWDVDFYMLCVYNRTRTPEEIRKLLGVLPLPPNELYLETDPPRAYEVARKTPKTCLLFKILAAGRRARSPEEVDKAFKEAFDNIKPQDCVVVGMFPRFQDQVKENCDRVRRILNYNA